MTYNPIDDNSDGVVDADVNNETVDTESIQDKNDGQAWETLREVGYQKGEYVVWPVGHSEAALSTPSTSYTTLGSGARMPRIDMSVYPDPVVIGVTAGLSSDTAGETAFLRAAFSENDAQSFPDTEISVTGTSGQNPNAAFAEVNTSAVPALRFEGKSSSSGASASMLYPVFYVGVKL